MEDHLFDTKSIKENPNRSKEKLQSFWNYNPFYGKNNSLILRIELFNEGETLYILLKNGSLLRINKSDKSIESSFAIDNTIPQFNIPTKVVNISCGTSHILLLGQNGKVYGSGHNSRGQLGLGESELKNDIKEHREIDYFKSKEIFQIYANRDTSFCISSDGTVYGFGDNQKKQITEENSEPIIPIPVKIQKFSKEESIQILFNKGHKKYYIKLIDYEEDPSFQKKEEEEGKNKKKRKNSNDNDNSKRIDEKSNLLQDIDDIIIKYYEKLCLMESSKTNKKDSVRSENVNKQIHFLQSRKAPTEEEMKKYFSNFDGRIYKIEDTQKKKPAKITRFTKNVPNVESLLERVNWEMQIQKQSSNNDLVNNQDEKENKIKEKMMKIKELLEKFKSAKEEVKAYNLIKEEHSLEEEKMIKEKIELEFKNFTINTVSELVNVKINNPKENISSLNDIIITSSNNLTKLTEKIKSLHIYQGSKMVKLIYEIFNTNITLTHQNNYLLSFILTKLVNPAYIQTMEKALNYQIPHDFDFKKLKDKIDNYKRKNRRESTFFKINN